MMRRLFWLCVGLWCLQAPVWAQEWPSKPIRLIVPFPAGGPTDLVGREAANILRDELKQSVVVENRPGGNGVTGLVALAKAPPDGYTIGLLAITAAIAPHVGEPGFDAFKDFAPITNFVSMTPVLIANKDAPFNSLAEMIKAGKAGGKFAYGTPGVATVPHLAAELLQSQAGIPLLHVPYKGVAPALNSLLAGETQVIFIPPTIAVQHVKTGKARALGFTGSKRWPLMPEVPTILEAGVPDFEITGSWHGWLAPAKTPPAVIARIQVEAKKALQVPRVREFLVAGGYEPDGSTPEEFRKFLKTESARYAEAVRAAGIKPE